jgi:hypothetical protein
VASRDTARERHVGTNVLSITDGRIGKHYLFRVRDVSRRT